MRVGVAVARARRGTTNINFPLIDEFGARRDGVSRRVARPAVLIDQNIASALGCFASEECAKAEGS